MTTAELQSSLGDFVKFTRTLKGDEKSEAQIFLDHFFRSLGHGGVQEAGATLEFRIAKKPGSAQLELIKDVPGAKAKGGKKFADLLREASLAPEVFSVAMSTGFVDVDRLLAPEFGYRHHLLKPFGLFELDVIVANAEG